MKTTELKILLKEAIREVFQEELKNIILEALTSSKKNISEDMRPYNMVSNNTAPLVSIDRKQQYQQILAETSNTLTNTSIPKFTPTPGVDLVNGSLPEGDVSMDQIMGLIGK